MMADMNGDKWLDLVTVNDAGDAISVYYFGDTEQKFKYSTTFNIEKETSSQKLVVENVIHTKESRLLQSLLVTIKDTKTEK